MTISNKVRVDGVLISLWFILICEAITFAVLLNDIGNLKGSLEQIALEKGEVQAVSEKIQKIEKQLTAAQKHTSNPPVGFSLKRVSSSEEKIRTIERKILESTEHRNKEVTDARLLAKVRYGFLLSKLNLREDQADRLLGFFVDKAMVDNDINKTIQHQKPNMSPLELLEAQGRIVAEAKSEIEANIKELLGEEKFNLYQDYINHISQNLLVGELQQTLARGSALSVLTDSQKDQLVSILSENRIPNADSKSALLALPSSSPPSVTADNLNFQVVGPNDSIVDPSGEIHSNFGISDAAVTAAQKLLNAEQLKVLESIKARQMAERKMSTQFHFNASN